MHADRKAIIKPNKIPQNFLGHYSILWKSP